MPKPKIEVQHPNVTNFHRGLHDFLGDWNLSQKIWPSPDASPLSFRGTSKCTSLLDGLATVMITEVPERHWKGMAIMTYNAQKSRYDLAYMDTNSTDGLNTMWGHTAQQTRAALREEFGDRATAKREWSTSIAVVGECLPPEVLNNVAQFAAAGSHATHGGVGAALAVETVDEVPMRLVENQVSDDHWVLEFFGPGPNGASYLVQQNTFTRA